MSSHTSLAQDLSLVINISTVIHERTSLSRFSSSTSTCPFFFFSFHLLHCEPYSELDNLIVMESLCYSANKESEDADDVSHSFTGYEPKFLTFGEFNDSSIPFSFMIPSSDQDVDDVTLGKMLTEAHRGQADYCGPEAMSVSQSSLSVVFDGSGQPDERNSSNAQTRTLVEEQRKIIVAEYREKVSHHDLQAERQLLQGQLWRQKLEIGEAHQQSLTEMEELRKFQSSKFATIARRKRVEDQNTILELSGRNQELQNEVNCMSDAEDFQDAESVRSGNAHVTSRPVSCPPHPILEGMLRIHGMSGNVFADPHASSVRRAALFIHNGESVKGHNKIKMWDVSQDRQPEIQSTSVEETLQRIMGETNNDCRFLIFTLTRSIHQQPLLAGR